MYFVQNKGYVSDMAPFAIERFTNELTLNIFTDASYLSNRTYGSYCALAVCKNEIIDMKSGYGPCHSNGLAEIRALRNGFDLAIRYSNQFPYINVFADSIYAIRSTMEWIYRWQYDPEEHVYLKNSRNKSVAMYAEDIYENLLLFESCIRYIGAFNIYHVKAHSSYDKAAIEDAVDSFRTNNFVPKYYPIYSDFIRYISIHNNRVDDFAKRVLNNSGYNYQVQPCISFIPQKIIQPEHQEPKIKSKGRQKKLRFGEYLHKKQ